MSAEPRVVVIDYGLGNLLSVRRGLERVGATVDVSSDPAVVSAADRLVLPGVGAFSRGMEELRARGLSEAVAQAANEGTPVLGICLGMQLLFDSSLEFGPTDGLGLLAGRIKEIPAIGANGEPHKVPHVGWSALVPPEGHTTFPHPVVAGLEPGDSMYFVHSFMAAPTHDTDRIADGLYCGTRVPAIVGRGSVVGCQFHPEKSGAAGLSVLTHWLGNA